MDPLELERTYRNARHRLSLLTGPRNRLQFLLDLIGNMLEPSHGAALPAYADEIASLLVRALGTVDFSGTPPSLAERTGRLIDALASRELPPGAQDRLAEARRLLDRAAQGVTAPPDDDPRAGFTVSIPMVEEEYLLPDFAPRFARIVRLHVDVRLRPDRAGDEIALARLAAPAEAGAALEDALLGARAALARWTKISPPAPVSVYCSAPGTEAINGSSLGAGLAAGIMCALLQISGHPEEFRVRSDVAITGLVDPQGRLLPVAPGGLFLKIETAVHCGVRYLVVPASQHAAAAEALSRLPDLPQSITIIPAGALEEIFFDRRLVDSRRVPGPVRAGRTLWRHRRPAAAALFLLLLLIIVRLAFGPVDRTPAGFRFAGSEMMIVNGAGEPLQTIPVGTTTANAGSAGVNHVASLLDLEADGTPEVFYTELLGEGGEPVGLVHCRTVGEEEDRWVVRVHKRVTFPHNAVEGEEFGPFGILTGDLDLDGAPEVLVIARHQAFPSLLLMLDARSGAEKAAYLHTGHITAIDSADLDRDGRPEILLTGVNNSLGEAFLAVLDPRCLDGHGPAEGKYRPLGIQPAWEKAYLRFPKTIVEEAHPDRVRWNIGVGLHHLASTQSIRVTVREYVQDENRDHDDVTYYIILASNLSPIRVETGDDFDLLAVRYLRERRIARTPDVQYWADYIERIRYWTSGTWGPHTPLRSCNIP